MNYLSNLVLLVTVYYLIELRQKGVVLTSHGVRMYVL
jgi:hypothetical protein